MDPAAILRATGVDPKALRVPGKRHATCRHRGGLSRASRCEPVPGLRQRPDTCVADPRYHVQAPGIARFRALRVSESPSPSPPPAPSRRRPCPVSMSVRHSPALSWESRCRRPKRWYNADRRGPRDGELPLDALQLALVFTWRNERAVFAGGRTESGAVCGPRRWSRQTGPVVADGRLRRNPLARGRPATPSLARARRLGP